MAAAPRGLPAATTGPAKGAPSPQIRPHPAPRGGGGVLLFLIIFLILFLLFLFFFFLLFFFFFSFFCVSSF